MYYRPPPPPGGSSPTVHRSSCAAKMDDTPRLSMSCCPSCISMVSSVLHSGLLTLCSRAQVLHRPLGLQPFPSYLLRLHRLAQLSPQGRQLAADNLLVSPALRPLLPLHLKMPAHNSNVRMADPRALGSVMTGGEVTHPAGLFRMAPPTSSLPAR